MACNCIKGINQELIAMGSNTMLDVPATLDKGQLKTGRVTVATCKRNMSKREKPMKLLATYCPFCGTKYEEKPNDSN